MNRYPNPDMIGCQFIEEMPTALFINGRHTATVLLAPSNQEEYVTGFLFVEQYISKPEEIESVRIEKNRISVLTTNLFTNPGPKKTILSGCGGAVSYIDTKKLPVISGTYTLSRTLLQSSLCSFLDGCEKNLESNYYSCLCASDTVLLCKTDIGEEQVFDRMLGAALMQERDLPCSYCLTSVSITSEVVRKCLMAQIPLVLSTRSITRIAGDIAAKQGLCVGVIKDGSVMVCSHPERITGTN